MTEGANNSVGDCRNDGIIQLATVGMTEGANNSVGDCRNDWRGE